jgi:CheY-like chemotaxis protein
MKIARNRVFIIDDDAMLRDVISVMLEKNGYLTVTADSMEPVLSLDTPVNLIIIDIFMPGMGGIEGIQRVREKWPDAKILSISAGWKSMDKKKALEAAGQVGADFILAKPFTEEDLLKALTEIEER